ncbi:MAG TPA: Ku protein [Acidothermaceae bacterium]
MRSIWKGSISFGLVSIAVKVYSATEEKDIAFHQVHRDDGGRIKYKRICSIDGEEVAYNDIAKGYELPDGDVVVLTDDDLAELPLTSNREIDVLQFVPLDQVDPIYFNKSYYLEPDARATKAYVLLRDTLEKSGRVAVVKVALRRREALATLRVREGVITLETMLWPDEIRAPEFGFLDESVDVRPAETAMASSLVDSLSGDFDPSDFTDQYRAALESVVEAKIEGRDLIPAPDSGEAEASGTVVDLVAALQASIAAVKAGAAAGAAGAAKRSPAAKKPAAAKSLASKSPASKAASPKAATPKAVTPSSTATRAVAKKAATKTPAVAKAVEKAVEKKPVRARRSA